MYNPLNINLIIQQYEKLSHKEFLNLVLHLPYSNIYLSQILHSLKYNTDFLKIEKEEIKDDTEYNEKKIMFLNDCIYKINNRVMIDKYKYNTQFLYMIIFLLTTNIYTLYKWIY
jgi:hypothetical protein